MLASTSRRIWSPASFDQNGCKTTKTTMPMNSTVGTSLNPRNQRSTRRSPIGRERVDEPGHCAVAGSQQQSQDRLGLEPAFGPLSLNDAEADPNRSVATIAGVAIPRNRRCSMTLYFSEASVPGAT